MGTQSGRQSLRDYKKSHNGKSPEVKFLERDMEDYEKIYNYIRNTPISEQQKEFMGCGYLRFLKEDIQIGTGHVFKKGIGICLKRVIFHKGFLTPQFQCSTQWKISKDNKLEALCKHKISFKDAEEAGFLPDKE